jgi:hypothetical protein
MGTIMPGSVSSIDRVGSNLGVSAPSQKGPTLAPPGASNQVGTMAVRGPPQGSKSPQVHESEFTKAAHLSLEAQEAKFGTPGSGKDVAVKSANQADTFVNTTAAASHGIKNAGSSAKKILDL